MLYDHYNAPDFVNRQYYVDGNYGSDPAAYDTPMWYDYFERQLSVYKTDNILVMWGDDFSHKRADRTFYALDTIIDQLESKNDPSMHGGKKYDFRFSTMERYFNSVFNSARQNNVVFSKNTSDFWAYNYHSNAGAYWTGYFTTYPEIKLEIGQFGDFAMGSSQMLGLMPEQVVAGGSSIM